MWKEFSPQKRFSPSWSKSDWYRNMADPDWPEMGLGMKEAKRLFSLASCLMTRRAVMMASAALTASA